MLIRLRGHACETAAIGPAALEVASAFRPNVVLMDIGLPGMDGYAAARALRKLPGASEAAFVAMTGFSQGVDAERSAKEGFAMHLLKPADPVELLDVLARCAVVVNSRRPPP